MMEVFVIWKQDEDDYFVTYLAFEDNDIQRQAMGQWSVADYVAQAFEEEHPGEVNRVKAGETFTCITIFEAPTARFVY